MRIAINTGGGDAPGLNAVIRSAVLSAEARGWEVFGIRKGYNGLFSGDPDGVVRLDKKAVRGITHLGGTILGTTNRGDPFHIPVKQDDGSIEMVDRSGDVLAAFRNWGIDCLIAVGGDGSLHIANQLSEQGLKVIGVPKTIDNDLAATAVTFGFQTAVQIASDALGRLHSTAQSHRRTMVVELMGRDAGWISLFAGVSSTADIILIPEIPYDFNRVCDAVEARYDGDDGFCIVVVAEGARPRDGEQIIKEIYPNTAGRPRLGGIADTLAAQIQERTGRETRSLVLGHLQRGGEPIAYDKILALRFGAAAVELAEQGQFGCMVALHPPNVSAVPIKEAIAKLNLVPVDGDVVRTAKALGISFGD